MMLVLRQIADMLWNYKIFHIIVLCVLIFNIVKFLTIVGISRISTFKVSVAVLLVIIYITIILQISFNNNTILLYFKIVSSLLMIVYGTLDHDYNKTIRYATYLSILIVLFNAIAAISGIGYQIWGGTSTYAGPYFFKTDLALAISISLSLILCSDWIKAKYKYILILLCLYLIIISNARAYYVIAFSMLIFYFFKEKLVKNFFQFIPIGITCAILFTTILKYIPNLMGKEMLMLNLTLEGFYSAENTQGRNAIWDAILGRFFSLDFHEQLIGLGLDGDVILSANYLDNELAGFTAHNGYVYLLVATGWIGLVIFLSFIMYICLILVNLLKRQYLASMTLVPVALTMHTMIYLFSNISSSNIVFQQESWFFMYLVGCGLRLYHAEIVNVSTSNAIYKRL